MHCIRSPVGSFQIVEIARQDHSIVLQYKWNRSEILLVCERFDRLLLSRFTGQNTLLWALDPLDVLYVLDVMRACELRETNARREEETQDTCIDRSKQPASLCSRVPQVSSLASFLPPSLQPSPHHPSQIPIILSNFALSNMAAYTSLHPAPNLGLSLPIPALSVTAPFHSPQTQIACRSLQDTAADRRQDCCLESGTSRYCPARGPRCRSLRVLGEG
jgi:hypothetical protein